MTIRQVTVGLDLSTPSEELLRWADTLVARTAGRLQAVTVWHLPYLPASADVVAVAPPVAEIEEQTHAALRRLVDAEGRSSRIEPIVVQGSAATALIEASSADDLLVVGRRGMGSLRALGSTSRHVAIHADCSVAVVPVGASEPAGTLRIAVAVDGSDSSVSALAWALTNFPGSEILAMNSRGRHDPPASEVLEPAVDAARAITQSEWPVDTLELEGDPRSSVIEAASDRDLLLVGDRGRGGVVGLILGSFATYAVGHTPPPLPVVVVRQGGSPCSEK